MRGFGLRLATLLVGWGMVSQSVALGQGILLPGGGASHLSMAGVSMATPVDAIGAMYWNPAAIGRLGRSEVALGGSFLFPNFSLDSTAPGVLGPVSGSTNSDSGVGVAPNLAFVQQAESLPISFGLGLNTVAGGGVNFPGDVSNPILSGIGALGNVQGPIASNLLIFQMTPTVAYQVTERVIVGAGPTVDIAIVNFDPAYFATPNDSIGLGPSSFPTASHSRPFWGGGWRAGIVVEAADWLHFGFSYISTQWFDTWTFHARNELGQPRTLQLNASLPATFSLGASIQVTERWLLATDLRWLDYSNTNLFGTRVVDGGLGWRDVFAIGIGTRYQVTDRAAASIGYLYNDNPIPEPATLFNVQSPCITQHMLTLGGTLQLTDAMSASLGYVYGFQNSITGPVREAAGIGVEIGSNVHLATFTLQFRYGGGVRCPADVDAFCCDTPTDS